MSLLSLVLWLWTTPAQAGTCESLYQIEMEELVEASQRILQTVPPDLEEHSRLVRQVEQRLACADFEVPPELWARFLVSVAVRNYFDATDWQKPLTTALRIDPDVDLGVDRQHPILQWEAPPRPASRGELPEGVTLWLDGEELHHVVRLDATHLLQRWDGDELQTAVIWGPGEIPAEFLTRPRLSTSARRSRRQEAVHTWGTVGSGALILAGGALLGGGLAAHQRFADPTTPQEELADLSQQGRGQATAGSALLIGGAATATAVWTIQW